MFTFDIYNIGDETAYSIPVDIYVDGVWKNQHHVNSIDAGYARACTYANYWTDIWKT